MRFASIIFAGALAVFASAQSPTSSARAALTSEQAAIDRCISACTPGDVNCTSKCIAVPNPNEDQVSPFCQPTHPMRAISSNKSTH